MKLYRTIAVIMAASTASLSLVASAQAYPTQQVTYDPQPQLYVASSHNLLAGVDNTASMVDASYELVIDGKVVGPFVAPAGKVTWTTRRAHTGVEVSVHVVDGKSVSTTMAPRNPYYTVSIARNCQADTVSVDFINDSSDSLKYDVTVSNGAQTMHQRQPVQPGKTILARPRFEHVPDGSSVVVTLGIKVVDVGKSC